MLEEQLPYLAHYFAMPRAVVESTPWRDLAVYRAHCPNLPTPGVVFLGDPKKR